MTTGVFPQPVKPVPLPRPVQIAVPKEAKISLRSSLSEFPERAWRPATVKIVRNETTVRRPDFVSEL